MRTTINIPASMGTRYVEHALEGLARIAAQQIADAGGSIPPLYRSGVRYERERDSENWRTPEEVLTAGTSDCEDLSAYRVGELRASGADPGARIVIIRTGPRTLHAVVRRSDGTIEDPSRALGMKGPGDGVELPAPMLVGVEREHTWYEARRRARRGELISAPTLADALDGYTTGAAEGVGFLPVLDTVARAAQGALSAVVPGMGPRGAPTEQSPAHAARAARAIAQQFATQQRAAPASPVSASDVLSIASQLARVVHAEKLRDRRERARRPRSWE